MKISKLIITTIILFALISLTVPKGSCLNVSVRAIKARESDEYSPNTTWELGYTGKGINIAIIDRGVDDEHESLNGKFVAGADFSKPLTPKDGTYNPEGCQHGTYCAGIALGTSGHSMEYMGVAPNAKLIDVSLGSHTAVSVIPDVLEDAINWCIVHKDTDWNQDGTGGYEGVSIISISVGTYTFTEQQRKKISDALERAVDVGIVVVDACGNSGPNNNPPMVYTWPDGVIEVGATDDKNTVSMDDDEIADFSTIGPREDDGDDDPYDELRPDVVAPGVDIIAPMYGTHDKYGYSKEGEGASGTSFSAPHVAGVVALMLEANPHLTPEEVRMLLLETAEQRGIPEYPDYPYPYNKWNRAYGCGIVDAYVVVKKALDISTSEQNKNPTITIDSPTNNAEVSNTITISGTASDSDGDVTNVELKFDNNNWFNIPIISESSLEWNYIWDTKNGENGKHTIYARAFDGENYSSIQSIDVNVYNNETTSDGVEKKKEFIPGFDFGIIITALIAVFLYRKIRK